MSGVQSIERAFALLRALTHGAAGVTELADQAGLPKSTVSRLLASLEQEGVVEQVEPGGEYVIGDGLRQLGEAANPTANVAAAARPVIEALSAETGASAGITIRYDREVYWVENVDNDDELVQITDMTGQHFPMHTVPTGLALLSKLSASELDEFLAGPLEAENDLTITDPEELRRLVEGIRGRGVVASFELVTPDINAFAAPFRGSSGEWIGGIYVQGPSFRFPGDLDVAHVERLITTAASRLSDRLALH